MTWMALLDESAADLISGQLSVNVFRATDEEDMARLRLGDIIVMAGLKVCVFVSVCACVHTSTHAYTHAC